MVLVLMGQNSIIEAANRRRQLDGLAEFRQKAAFRKQEKIRLLI
jgi:hypothetical protein